MRAPAFNQPTQTSVHRTSNAFTLIELLTVVAIVGILATITIPAINHTRHTADDAQCRSALRYWGVAINLYMSDNAGYLPGPLNTNVSPVSDPEAASHNHLGTKLAPYILPNPTERSVIPDDYVCRGWAREKGEGEVPIWNQPHTVPRLNAAGNVYPWGYPTNANNNKPQQWTTLADQTDVRTSHALRDIDKELAPSATDGRPPLPVHGTHRNVLYLDWHVGQESVGTN